MVKLDSVQGYTFVFLIFIGIVFMLGWPSVGFWTGGYLYEDDDIYLSYPDVFTDDMVHVNLSLPQQNIDSTFSLNGTKLNFLFGPYNDTFLLNVSNFEDGYYLFAVRANIFPEPFFNESLVLLDRTPPAITVLEEPSFEDDLVENKTLSFTYQFFDYSDFSVNFSIVDVNQTYSKNLSFRRCPSIHIEEEFKIGNYTISLDVVDGNGKGSSHYGGFIVKRQYENEGKESKEDLKFKILRFNYPRFIQEKKSYDIDVFFLSERFKEFDITIYSSNEKIYLGKILPNVSNVISLNVVDEQLRVEISNNETIYFIEEFEVFLVIIEDNKAINPVRDTLGYVGEVAGFFTTITGILGVLYKIVKKKEWWK